MPDLCQIKSDVEDDQLESAPLSNSEMPIHPGSESLLFTDPNPPVTSWPSPPVVYRYIYKDVDGEIIQQKEDIKPIKFTSDETKVLTDQTVLEVVTTKKSSRRKTLEDTTESAGDPSKENTTTSIKIHSSYIINALRDLVSTQWEISLDSEVLTMEEPYRVLVHHIEDLRVYKTRHPAGHSKTYVQVCNDHIDILLGFLDDSFQEDLRLERQRHLKSPPMATFQYIWLLFKPGDDVFVNETSDLPFMPMTVYKSGLSISRSGPSGRSLSVSYEVKAWSVLSTGSHACSPMPRTIWIEEFDGEKEVSTLAVFPKRFHQSHLSLEEQFIARGKKWFQLRNLSYKEYSGSTLSIPKINVRFTQQRLRLVPTDQSHLLDSRTCDD
jgi:hypothetical protein